MANLLDEERLRVAGMMVATIIHDLKNPLNYGPSAASMLMRAKDDPDRVEEFASDVIQSFKAMQSVFEAVKAISSGKELKLNEIGLHLLTDEFDKYKEVRENSVFNDMTRGHTVYANKYGLGVVIHNLIKNAFDARADATVNLTSWHEDGKTFIYVSDNGPGMNQQQIDNLFGGYTSHENTEDIRGLGMQIVHELVTVMRGEIQCNSELGKGTQFTIIFPSSAS